MSAYVADIDIVVDIYHTVSTSVSIGTQSPYTSVPHPGTGNTIKGWLWDKRTWPTDIEIKATDFAPAIFDPSTNFVPEEAFQSGIGDNEDLKILAVTEEQASNIKYWTPRINHGHFYMHDEEWYLYSDDAVRMLMDATVTSGVLQYKDLEFKPKPGVPISVRRYKWNYSKNRYEIDLDFRKRLQFTGIVTDSEEADTVDENGQYQLDNIDRSKPEFVVEYDSDPIRVVLNYNYEEEIGVSGTLSSLEFLGISDGDTNEYHLPYAPVSPSGLVQLITWDERTSTEYSWSRIETTANFTEGPYTEFKLDDHLGIITFGDYDENTTSGAGARPGTLHQIGLVYTRGLELLYEPENTRDWIESRTADTNPFHNPINQGFVKVTSQATNPQYIQLTSDLDGDAINGYEIELSNKTGKVIATVISSEGEKMEGEQVVFEILAPEFGTFSNLDLEAQSTTNNLGVAYTQYVPPSTIDQIGKATVSVSDSGAGDTILTIDGLLAPDRVEDIYLYKVLVTDPVLGIAASEEDTFYESYLTAEDIDEDPDGDSSTVQYEKDFRGVNQLLTPTLYEAGDLTTGSKVIVASVSEYGVAGQGPIDPNYAINSAVDPDYDTAGTLTSAPYIPYDKLNSGSTEDPVLELTYSGVLASPDNTTFKSYFVVCPATTRLRAKVINRVSGKVIYSNVIEITTTIPPEASGVSILEDINDLQADVFNRVKHIDEISDVTVLTHSGELWSEYLEDRVYSEETQHYYHFTPDDRTAAFWPLDSGNLHDWSLNANHFDNVGGMIPAQGFLGGAFRSTTPGTPQFLDSPNLYDDISLQSGTIDFLFKSDTNTPSGTTFKLFEFCVTGSNGRRNRLEGIHEQTSVSGIRFRFNYEVSGTAGGSPNAYLLHQMMDNGIYLTNGEWHSMRFSWDYNQETTAITLAGQIDDQLMTGGISSSVLGFRPDMGTLTGGKVQAFGDLTASGSFYFDEIRWSTMPRTDNWPPYENLVSGESFIDWFRRSRKADTNRLLLQNMVFSGYLPARLPLGFRLKSTGITVASMLDRVTFITVNDHLPDDYFDEE